MAELHHDGDFGKIGIVRMPLQAGAQISLQDVDGCACRCRLKFPDMTAHLLSEALTSHSRLPSSA